MHIEKNVCDSIISILLNIPNKTKVGIKGRKDLVEISKHKQVAPEQKRQNTYLLSACHTLSRKGKIDL